MLLVPVKKDTTFTHRQHKENLCGYNRKPTESLALQGGEEVRRNALRILGFEL